MKGIDVYVEEAVQNRGVSVLRVSGYVDTTTSPELERRMQALLREKRYHIVVDLSRVEYISSAGWGIFISEIREIREHGGDLKLAGMVADVREVFDLLEFENILQAFPEADLVVRADRPGRRASGRSRLHDPRPGLGADRSGPHRRGHRARDRAAAPRLRPHARAEGASEAGVRIARAEPGAALRPAAQAGPRHPRGARVVREDGAGG